MASDKRRAHHESVGGWAKRLHLTSQSVMESLLRPFDLGPTQWYVLCHLAEEGPTPQSALVHTLRVERATMSGIVAALVRKGYVEQIPDPGDQRRKILRLTAGGEELWERLPDPVDEILAIAFEGVPQEAQDHAIDVLRAATERLTARLPARHPRK
ncbi:transcriptional regulator [Streptomyces sp. SPB78]|uniref:MarR family winged helix-turn-helix transcriptional regulator n=1 Tax=Streptomyces sp. (strain SPB78) TaxID=591157 RepID=UPI0001DEDBBA|nr:MarR family transcriptional regulator [Streptomyces sp. SPB78]EFL03527.1 transcriptional regulator [Streptomyces sp. SPB78]